MAAILATVLFAATVTASEPKVKTPPSGAKPQVVVQLSISVDEFDPAEPKGTVKCIVRNGLEKAVEIPERYDSHRITLIGQSHRFPLRLWNRTRDRKEPPMIELKPGSDKVAFEFPLAEILRVQDPKVVREDYRAGRPVLVWDWMARPAPPPSPIHMLRDGGFVEKALFWAEVTVEGATVSSDKVVLKVKK